MIIKDGVVINQNIKSVVLGKITGEKFCDNCIGKDVCENKDDCPLYRAEETMQPSSGFKLIKGMRYKLDVMPTKMQDRRYLIVLATEVSDSGDSDRRFGDRRKEPLNQQGEDQP